MTPGRDCDVLIAGAGPTGLMLALWLARLGVRVRIVDRTAAPGTTSRALVMHARSLEFYQQLGLADAIVGQGRKFAGIHLWAHGNSRGEVRLGDIGVGLSPFPFMLIFPQDEQERLQVESLRTLGVEVERRTELTGFDDRGDAVIARVRAADGPEETLTCRYLAGCDGAHSAVRHGLQVGFAGDVYENLFYVADVEARGNIVNGDLNLALDTSDFLAVFPLTREGHARLIGTVRRDVANDAREALRWEDVSHAIIARLGLDVQKVNWFSTYRVHHRVASRFRAGRAFLLGDAAHIHSPVGGQGMNTGLGDAVNLSWKLAMAVQGRADDRLLDSYEPERIAFAHRLVETTDRAFTFVSSDGALAQRVRENLVPWLVPELLRFAAARRFMFRTVSQIAIAYRDSALSAGEAGDVHGGDRLPWTGDNYAPLASLSWQAHVYGPVTAEFAAACASLGLPMHAFPSGAGKAGVPEGACCIVRPDGYVGLIARSPDALAVRQYFADRGLRP